MRMTKPNRGDALGAFAPMQAAPQSRYAEAIVALVQRLEQRAKPLDPSRARGKRASKPRVQDRSHTIKLCLRAVETLSYYSIGTFGRELDPTEYTTAICQDFAVWLRGEQRTRAPRTPDVRGLLVRAGGEEMQVVWQTTKDLITRRGEVVITQIAAALPAEAQERLVSRPDASMPSMDFARLHRILGKIVRDYRILIRNPPVAVLRRQLGEIWSEQEKDPLNYSYTLPTRRVLSLKTVSTMLAALSMVWNSFNEVVGEAGVSIIANPWRAVSGDWASRAKRWDLEQQALGVRKVLSTPMLQALLLAARGTRLESYRDVLAITLMAYMGLRSEEVASLLRTDMRVVDEIQCLAVTGKGQKLRVLPLYSEVRDAIRDLEQAARRGSDDYETNEQGERVLTYSSLYCRALLEPDAPLVPSLERWGCNRREDASAAAKECLDPSGMRAILARLADRARVRAVSPPGLPRPLTPQENVLVHPHSLRHYAATAAAKGGVPLLDIQEMLGHEDVNTTGIYIEVPAQASMAFASAVSREIAGKSALTAEDFKALQKVRRWPIDDATIEAVDPWETRPASARKQSSISLDMPERPSNQPVGSPTWAYSSVSERLLGYVPGANAKAWSKIVKRNEEIALGRLSQAQAASDGPAAGKFYQEMLDERAKYLYVTFRVGDRSKLPWWAGRANRWPREQMAPIMSPSQACPETVTGKEMIAAIETLYREFWDTIGPSAASALVVWLGELLDTVYVGFARCMSEKQETWVTFEDPADPELPFVREHLQSEILNWLRTYGSVAYVTGYKSDKNQGNVALIAMDTLPEWMWSDDPLLELPTEERASLRTWVEGLQGIRPSRKRAREMFDQIVAKLGALKAAFRTRGTSELAWESDSQNSKLLSEIRQDLLTAYPRAAVQVLEVLKDSTGLAGIALSERLRRTLKDQGVAVDDAVVADGVLGDPDPKYVSHVFDAAHLTFDGRGTIVHSEAVRRKWFERFGTDSECVARRALRVLWDRRSRAARSQAHGLIIRHFDMWLSSILPCPKQMEERMRQSGWSVDTDPVRASQLRAATWRSFIETLGPRAAAASDMTERARQVFAKEAAEIEAAVVDHDAGQLVLSTDLAEFAPEPSYPEQSEVGPIDQETARLQAARAKLAVRLKKNRRDAAKQSEASARLAGAVKWDGAKVTFPLSNLLDLLKDREEYAVAFDFGGPVTWLVKAQIEQAAEAVGTSKTACEIDLSRAQIILRNQGKAVARLLTGQALPPAESTLLVRVSSAFSQPWVDNDPSSKWVGYPSVAKEDFDQSWVTDLSWPDQNDRPESWFTRLKIGQAMRAYAAKKRALTPNSATAIPTPVRMLFAGVWQA